MNAIIVIKYLRRQMQFDYSAVGRVDSGLASEVGKTVNDYKNFSINWCNKKAQFSNENETCSFYRSTMGKDSEILMAPLMMDIYFMIDDNMEEEKAQRKQLGPPIAKKFYIPDKQKSKFDELFKDSETLIKNEFNKLLKRKDFIYKKVNFDDIFKKVKKEEAGCLLFFDLNQSALVTFEKMTFPAPTVPTVVAVMSLATTNNC